MPKITRMGKREATPGLKLETNKLWGADAPAHRHRPFPPIALLPAETCGPLPSGSPESGLFQLPTGFTSAGRLVEEGMRQSGRAQSSSDCTSVTLHNCCFLDPKQGCSAEPDSHPSCSLPSAPLLAKQRVSLHQKCSWVYTAPVSSPRILQVLQLPSFVAED